MSSSKKPTTFLGLTAEHLLTTSKRLKWTPEHRHDMIRVAIAGLLTLNVQIWQIRDFLATLGFLGHGQQLDAILARKTANAIIYTMKKYLCFPKGPVIYGMDQNLVQRAWYPKWMNGLLHHDFTSIVWVPSAEIDVSNYMISDWADKPTKQNSSIASLPGKWNISDGRAHPSQSLAGEASKQARPSTKGTRFVKVNLDREPKKPVSRVSNDVQEEKLRIHRMKHGHIDTAAETGSHSGSGNEQSLVVMRQEVLDLVEGVLELEQRIGNVEESVDQRLIKLDDRLKGVEKGRISDQLGLIELRRQVEQVTNTVLAVRAHIQSLETIVRRGIKDEASPVDEVDEDGVA